MADITKCEGGVCPYKEKCLRYTAREFQFQYGAIKGGGLKSPVLPKTPGD